MQAQGKMLVLEMHSHLIIVHEKPKNQDSFLWILESENSYIEMGRKIMGKRTFKKVKHIRNMGSWGIFCQYY